MRLVLRLCLITLVCLTGCAETKYRGDAMPGIAASQARIVFFRNSSFVGADMQTGILYDGSLVGNSRPGTYFYIDTTPGTHDISTTGDPNSHLGLTLQPGATRYVKTGLGLGQFAHTIEPESVDPNRALKELPELTFAPSGPVYVAGKPETSPAEAEVTPAQPATEPLQEAPSPSPMPAPVPEPAPSPAPMPDPTPAPAVQQDQNAAQNDEVPFHLGTSSNSVEELARREKQCETVHGAALVSSDGPIEYYREQCRDGRVFRAKCQFRQCVEIDSD